METINQKTGFSKRTHMLECEKCGENEYAESIGLWNDDGSLKGSICGACEIEQTTTQSIKWIYGEGEKEFYYVVTHIDYAKEKNTHEKKYFKKYDEAADYYKEELHYEEITKQTECMEADVVGGKIYMRKIGVKALADQICRLLSGKTEEFKVVNVGITYEYEK